MKTMIIFFAIVLSLSTVALQAQEKSESKNKTETIEIKTSAVCGMCKRTIEAALYDLNGVKSAHLNVPTKVVTVTFKTSKLTAHDIKKAISMAGYDADDIPADPAAYDELHDCCKKDAAH